MVIIKYIHKKFNNYLKIKLELKYGKYLEYYLKQNVRIKHVVVVKLCKCFIIVEYKFGYLRKNWKSRISWSFDMYKSVPNKFVSFLAQFLN